MTVCYDAELGVVTGSLGEGGRLPVINGLVRHALWLWWHDCTARELGEGHGMTAPLLETPSINALDHARWCPLADISFRIRTIPPMIPPRFLS